MRREGYPYDFERVAAAAVERGVHFEINASPERLDLGFPLLRAAHAKGAKFVISTDAHNTRHLDNMKYGVWTARRGWLRPADVLNTLDAASFRAAVRSEHQVRARRSL